MSNIFVISDFHFDHANILNFKTAAGKPLRVFDDVKHMNETIVRRYNEVVRPQDKCYILGDVAMKDTGIQYLKRLNGHKRLILGNHDYGNMRLYASYFESIYSSRLLDRMIFTHIPIHPESIGKNHANIHGHSHVHEQGGIGPRYFNVCCEALDFVPISLEDIKKKVMKQTGDSW